MAKIQGTETIKLKRATQQRFAADSGFAAFAYASLTGNVTNEQRRLVYVATAAETGR